MPYGNFSNKHSRLWLKKNNFHNDRDEEEGLEERECSFEMLEILLFITKPMSSVFGLLTVPNIKENNPE